LRNFRRTEGERIDSLKKTPYYPIFLERLEMMHTSQETRSEETGYILICPKEEGRIINVQPPLTHND